jgi:hypothetical protein
MSYSLNEEIEKPTRTSPHGYYFDFILLVLKGVTMLLHCTKLKIGGHAPRGKQARISLRKGCEIGHTVVM